MTKTFYCLISEMQLNGMQLELCGHKVCGISLSILYNYVVLSPSYPVRLNRVGGWVVGSGSCSFEDKKRYMLAPSVLGPNLQLPAHKLISRTPFMKR